MKEEDAFWVTCMIIEKYLPLDYYSNFFGVLADQSLLECLIERQFPDLHQHFIEIEMQTELLSFAWFIQLFVSKMPTMTVNLVWALFFLRGTRVLF